MRLTADDQGLREQLHPDYEIIMAEIVYHIRHELAVDPTDVLFRRTRLGFIDRAAVDHALPKVVQLFAKELKWDKARVEKELKNS